MAWNEPGNNNNDPWGNRNRNSGGKNDGPPDLDEFLRKTFGRFLRGGGGSGGGSRSGSGGSSGSTVIVVVIAVLAVLYFIKGIGIVNEQERAVVLRFGEYKETRGPGFRWNPPFIDKVFTENVTQVRTWSTKEQMLTKDLNIVDIKLSVQFSIDSARDFVLNTKNPEMSLQQASYSALRHVVGSTVMHEVLTEGRSRIAVEVEERLQSYLDAYTTGINVQKVNIEDTNPPKEVQWAFDDVIKAREDEERYKNEAQAYANDVIPRARGRAQRMVEEASGYRDQVIARAEGEAARFKSLLTEYRKAPEVTRERLYLEMMQEVLSNSSKILVDVEGGNNLMYLPLDKLMENRPRTTVRATPVTSGSELDELAARVVERLQAESQSNNLRRREGR
ncbi:FtsH protease activity modulator HflK [Saccharophagus sp. K07]|jgi:membrane protease subunit HflK|uniref:FtsH protease activity modulator HflK n=1 Tax=Saccharophagus sp. K07 TaxID=2283636 RepID=UPI001651B319|nr:FtsH protease activity modulator HflK [Saccharophagus sp. K07]MBC6905815.1 FtsH protease activity modulator HflK [Saccharophagus sp. K07]